MIKLDLKKIDMELVFNACVDGITILDEQKRYELCLPELNRLADEYKDLGENELLYTISALPSGEEDNPIVVSLTAEELKELYSYYMVKKSVGRKVYDKIMAAAQEECPFCGGLGNPRNLDHYLPKSSFPQFSITPHNLIPSCRDCNMDGKSTRYAKSMEKQIIHPYLDSLNFFDEQWIYANYTDGQPGDISYYVSVPDDWGEPHKLRAEEHFNAFNIPKLYERMASSHLGELIPQINSFLANCPEEPDLLIKVILQPVVNSIEFKNHWKKVMYQAIIESMQI